MLSHCLHFCDRVTDAGRHNYYILPAATVLRPRCTSTPNFGRFGTPQKKKRKCGAAREARRGKQVAHRLLLLLALQTGHVTEQDRTNPTRGSATKIGGRLPPARGGKPRGGKKKRPINVYGKKEIKTEGGGEGGGARREGGGGRDDGGGRWCRSEMKVHFFLGSKVSSRRGGRGPPPCSPAATGSHPPVPYVIRVTYGRV